MAKPAASIVGFQSKAKRDICRAILMLDLAAQHARAIGIRLSDPAARQDFDGRIAMIERSLDIAREMFLKL